MMILKDENAHGKGWEPPSDLDGPAPPHDPARWHRLVPPCPLALRIAARLVASRYYLKDTSVMGWARLIQNEMEAHENS